MRNPYEVLGISASADRQSIRRAYKKLAVEFHPDRNDAPEAVERFKEVAEAYAVLTSDHARERYARARRREYAARQEHRRQEEAARQRSANAHSETVAAAERAFREYARQVHERRQRAAAQASPVRPKPSVDWWGERVGPVLAVALMAVYVWRSSWGMPLQPWLSGKGFVVYPLDSPIWITLSLGMMMIVRPEWFRIPLVLDELRAVRLYGWMMLLVPPLLTSNLAALLPY